MAQRTRICRRKRRASAAGIPGALPNIPQNSPISEWTICPPISGSESTSTTSRPSRADSIAAVEPGDPGPDNAHVGA